MINRAELVEKLKQQMKRERVNMHFAQAQGLLEAIKLAEGMPDVNGSGPVWVNAEDAVPDDERAVLCLKQRKDGVRGYAIGHCFDGKWVVMGGCSVVAWMALPEMPEE